MYNMPFYDYFVNTHWKTSDVRGWAWAASDWNTISRASRNRRCKRYSMPSFVNIYGSYKLL